MPRVYKTIPTESIKLNPRNARTHSKKQIAQIVRSIREFGFAAPLLVDEDHVLIAGHGRLEAAKSLGLAALPAVIISDLSSPKIRALMLADNRIAQSAGWDREVLALELAELPELLIVDDLDLSITGFENAEIDSIQADLEPSSDPADDPGDFSTNLPAVAATGDLWSLGSHQLLCGNALSQDNLSRLMAGEGADTAFLDPPYNVRVSSIGGRGKKKHREFAMASGEMDSNAFVAFLKVALGNAAAVSKDGAVHYVCIDWRHVDSLTIAGRNAYGAMLNLIAWVKPNAGQGSFYRSQHELIGVFRVGNEAHLNNVELGRHGRNRSNVWQYAGVNSFGKQRLEDLRSHPTVKPVTMIVDAIKDCTTRGGIVLDTFCGSGSTLLAAERTGRRGRGMEIDPLYVDLAIRRWQRLTKKDAINAETNLTFDETAERAPPVPVRERPSSRSEGG